MRGIQIEFTLEWVLSVCGVSKGDLLISSTFISQDVPNKFIITLTGEDKRLPVLKPGDFWPRGVIVMTRGVDGHVVGKIRRIK